MSDTSSCRSYIGFEYDYSSVSSLSESHFISCSSSDKEDIPDDGIDISVKKRKLYVKHMHTYTTKISKETDLKSKEDKIILRKIRQRIKNARRMHKLYIQRIVELKQTIKDLRRKKNKKSVRKKRKFFVTDVKKIN